MLHQKLKTFSSRSEFPKKGLSNSNIQQDETVILEKQNAFKILTIKIAPKNVIFKDCRYEGCFKKENVAIRCHDKTGICFRDPKVLAFTPLQVS